jgi:multiple sugar transport system permease protein
VSARRASALSALLVNLVLALGAILTLGPLLWMVSASLMPAGQANTVPPPLLPDPPTMTHYASLFSRLNTGRFLLNSTIVTVAATLLSVLLNGMAGYAFAKLRFAGRERVFQLLLLALVIPAQVGMLPLFLLFKYLGLVNSLAGAVVPLTATVFGIFLVRQYALSIPDELLDAARIDGASEGRIFWTVVMPLLRPILTTLAIFTFISAWNDFMWPLVILNDERKYTLPVALASLSGEHVQDTELMMAGAVLTVLPVFAVFLLLQRHYVRGLMLGGVKG